MALDIDGNGGDVALLLDENSATNAKRDMITLNNTGNPQIVFNNENNNNSWVSGAGNAFVVDHRTTNTEVFRVSSTGDVEIPGTITTGGSCSTGCDAVFSAAYALPSIEEHAEAMWSNGYLPNVGPTIEGEPINVSEKMGRMLNELETAHIYIEQLNSALTDSNDQVRSLEARLARLEAAIER